MTKPNILIGLLAYGGAPRLACTKSLFQLFQAANSRGLGTALKTLDMTGVSTARNVVSSIFYASSQFTHLLFIDDDMAFAPEAAMRLVDAAKPIIGLAYPKRGIELSKLLTEARNHADHVAMARAADFAILALEGENQTVKDGMVQVGGIGMGITLISRTVFDQLAANVRRRDTHEMSGHGLTTPLYGFFDYLYEDNYEIPEDISFCLRWRRQCQGEVWAIVDETVGHIGEFTYQARLIDRLTS